MPFAKIIAETIRLRFQNGERMHIRLILRCIGAARRERNLDVVAGPLRRFLNGSASAENNQVSQRDLLREILLDPLERPKHFFELSGLVRFPILLRREANARSVRSTALVGAAEGRGRGPGRGDELGNRQARGENLRLQHRNILLA